MGNRYFRHLFFIFLLTAGCHTPATKPPPPALTASDTTKTISSPDTRHQNDTAIVLTTHLRDTTYAAGSFILFLCPDGARYAEFEKQAEDEAGDGDSDFGVGISGTQDSLGRNDRYKDIQVLVSTKRYICIRDCKDGPLIIDRDSVSYGYILSAKGKAISKTYNSVHSGNYVGEIEDYFSLH
jgi:hypothetical protein